MDTNSNDMETKKIGSVELIGLNSRGYGPKGKHTRQEWRDECLEHFENGQIAFQKWQESWINDIDESLPTVNFGGTIKYEDGTSEQILEGMFFNTSRPYCLDFVGQSFSFLNTAENFNFLQGVHFNAASFKQVMKFHGATFNKWVDFTSAVFDSDCYVDFINTKFLSFVRFTNVRFGYADFKNTIFSSFVDFENAIFSEQANFIEKTEFQFEVNFKRAFFIKDANFYNSMFFADANFNSTVFERDADFRNTIFAKKANFFKAKFFSQCRFDYDPDRISRLNEITKEVNFFDEVNFENVDIQNVGHFERAYFANKIPNFLGVDNAKTLLIFSGDEYFSKYDTQGNATDRIAQLKRLSEEQGQTDQMLMFNAFELHAKAKQSNAGIGFKLFTWLYKNMADYGRSFTQPLRIFIYLFLITFVGALIFAGKSAPIICTERMLQYDGDIQSGSPVSCLSYYQTTDEFKLSGYRAAFEYASYRASGILDFSDNDKQTSAINMRVFDQKVEPSWVRVYGVFKAIASTALLFLAALGLRNKYRIK